MKDFPNFEKGGQSRLVRKSPETSAKSTLKWGVIWGLLLLGAFFFVAQRIEFIRTERKIKTLMLQKRSLTASILPLELEERYLTHYGRIEKVAKEELNLVPPGPRQRMIIKIEAPKKAPLEEP